MNDSGTWNQLTTANVVLPLASWTTNRTGNFDWLGNLTLTHGLNPAEPQRYYQISQRQAGTMPLRHEMR